MKTKSAGSFALRPGTRRSLSLFVVLGVSIVASGASAQQLELTENELGDRALAYRDAGQLDEAAYTWRRLLRKNPRSAPAYFELSLIYLEQKKDALAKAALFRGMSYASGELEELAVKTFNKYGGRLANISLETAYAARDEQEALDARREARAGNTKVVPPAKAGLNNTPRPAVAIAPSVQTPQVPKPLKLASLAPKPGFIRGRAVFANGQPIPSFQMSAQGFAGEVNLGWAGSMLGLGYQDASNGRYEFRATSSFNRTKILPEALVARVDARAHLSYQGRTYKMDMHPLDGQRVGDSKGGFRGFVSEGVVRDFVLKLHGPRIGYEQNTPPRDTSTSGDSDDAFYGAYIAFDFYSRPELGLVTGSKVTLTLTPTAPLLDGSPAQTLVRTMPIREESTIGYRYYFRDIPIGDYSATATLTAPDGRSHKLQLHLQGGGGDYATAAPVIFQPWEGLMGVRHVHLITKP